VGPTRLGIRRRGRLMPDSVTAIEQAEHCRRAVHFHFSNPRDARPFDGVFSEVQTLVLLFLRTTGLPLDGRRLLFFLFGHNQEIENVFVINFHEGDQYFMFHFICHSMFVRLHEQILKRQHHDTGISSCANHCMCLTSTSLSICENGCVEPIKN